MVFKIASNAGHGGSGSTLGKRTPDGEYEWNFNNVIASAFDDEISKYKNVEVRRMDDTNGKTDVPLSTRTNTANSWGADLYISFHHNALAGVWGNHGGVETHVHDSKPEGSSKLAKVVQPVLSKSYGLRDRGIKYTNLHETRETKSDAVLIEGGFMDSLTDIPVLRAEAILKDAGKEIAIAVANHYGLEKKEVEKVDNNQPSAWAKSAWEYATDSGYFDGTRPKDNITRQEMAVVIQRMMSNIREYITNPIKEDVAELKQCDCDCGEKE